MVCVSRCPRKRRRDTASRQPSVGRDLNPECRRLPRRSLRNITLLIRQFSPWVAYINVRVWAMCNVGPSQCSWPRSRLRVGECGISKYVEPDLVLPLNFLAPFLSLSLIPNSPQPTHLFSSRFLTQRSKSATMGKPILLHCGDDIKWNHDLYSKLSSTFDIKRSHSMNREEFKQALKDKKFGDFSAVYRPFWNTGGEMSPWNSELMLVFVFSQPKTAVFR
jgi:hypothetical protein